MFDAAVGEVLGAIGDAVLLLITEAKSCAEVVPELEIGGKLLVAVAGLGQHMGTYAQFEPGTDAAREGAIPLQAEYRGQTDLPQVIPFLAPPAPQGKLPQPTQIPIPVG